MRALRTMARAHGIVLLCAIAAGSGLWIWSMQPEPVAPPLPESPAPAAPAASRPDLATGERRAAENGSSGAPTNAPRPDAVPTPPSQPSPTAATNVELVVMDLAARQPLPAFRWTFRPAIGDGARGTGERGRAALALPPQQTGQLLVEADGLRALRRELQTPAASAPPLRLELFLESMPAATGVVIMAKDRDGAPVGRLRIDLWQLAANAPPVPVGEDPVTAPLWKRGAAADDGVYALPSLDGGRYLLRAQPVGPDDAPLPLQPQRREFSFMGHEAVPLAMDFAPGVVLRLQAAKDGSEERQYEVVVSARGGGVRTAWRSRTASGRSVVGDDTVVLPGEAATLLALPIADYTVELRRDSQPIVLQMLGAGELVRTFTATLPR